MQFASFRLVSMNGQCTDISLCFRNLFKICNESVSEGLLVPMSDKELESMLNTAKDDMEWTERAKHLDEAGIKKQAKKKDDILEVGQIFFSI